MEINKHKKQFGNQAENYTKYRKPYIDELYDLLFSLAPKEGAKILDIACGTGKSTEPLVRNDLEVFGCDHDSSMIKEAKKQAELKKLHINYSVADVEHLLYEDDSFDVVTVGTAFHWFVNEKSMTEIKRVLKKDGLLFIFWTLTVKDTPEEDQIPSSIYRKFDWDRVPTELRDLDYISDFLTKNGMSDVKTVHLPFTYNTTVEERTGLQMSASSYEILSEENKKNFLDEVRSTLTQKLGDREYFTLEEEMQVCCGFKG
jgi:ubiquinone/menaquinone biosynthesis C-methylase UbiE